MKIVGGCYWETVREPQRRDLIGSGLRAAWVLSGLSQTSLLTYLDEESTLLARSFAASVGCDLKAIERPEPISFVYETPLSRPATNGTRLTEQPISSEGETVLAYGLVEAPLEIRGGRVVLDPQSPGLRSLAEVGKVDAQELAIVANRKEMGALSGLTGNDEAAASMVLEQTGSSVVVVKRGALGAVVVTKEGLSVIGPRPAPSVWPIGSGDFFSAAFAWAWGQERTSAVEAARFASLSTANWVSANPMPLNLLRAGGDQQPAEIGFKRPPRLYLAGPFFNPGERWVIELYRQAIIQLGAEVFSPLHEVGRGPASTVAPADLRGLEGCDGVLAVLDNSDTGTYFEVGYAASRGMPVVGFCESQVERDLTMLKGTGVDLYTDLSTAVYQAVWKAMAAIE